MQSILILLHCESNTGYAIGPLEATFFKMALELCGHDRRRVHFGYPSMKRGPSDTLPADFNQYVLVDTASNDPSHAAEVRRYVELNGIDTVFAFDQPVSRPLYKEMRAAGMRHFISYWGAPMSSIFGPVKRTLKRIEVALRRHGPDHYIFESLGMADTAVLGRGISRAKTSVVYLGVDADRFRPDPGSTYVYQQFDLPRQRRIFFYAGHMEERKGVAVIMRAANRLARERGADDWQVLLFGNQPGEDGRFIEMLSAEARSKVIFGGYRRDLDQIQRGCYAAVIASTGWDSFPRSGMEMQASGLPLLASALPGLRESVDPERSGYLFPPGDDARLAELMTHLLDNPTHRETLSHGARVRVEQKFSLTVQLQSLIEVVRRVTQS